MSKERTDIYQRITSKIVASLEQGVKPWEQPWNAEHLAGKITRPLRAEGTPYQGINILTLWVDATAKGFSCPVWMTYKQALTFGGNVRKGETGSPVVYADKLVRTETGSNGEEYEKLIPFLKGYTVFNCEQIDGLPARFYETVPMQPQSAARIQKAEAFAAATSARIQHGGNRAFYAIGPDYVQMPPFDSFRDAESYYATLLHELTHWTRHETRLNRDLGRKRWGDAGYAAEELVAELGAAFLCADLGLSPEPREDHAAYLAEWIKVLSNDTRAIFTAASLAQKAADYLAGLSAPVSEAA